MPELPEVETVRRGLEVRLVGEVVGSVEVRQPGILEACQVQDLQGLAGFRVSAIDRRAKYLLIRLEREAEARSLVVHLGMTGQLTYQADQEEATDTFRRLVSGYQKSVGAHKIDSHTHLVATFLSGARLMFRDPRRFGRILLIQACEEDDCPRLARLGPDAWKADPLALKRRWIERGGKRTVKAILLDQSIFGGVGNIYADEACFEARIRPQRILSSLSSARIDVLAKAVGLVLDKGVQNAGTSFRDFVGADGESGTNQEDLRVYGRGGQLCFRCGGVLHKAVVAQRTTVWCAKCQT